MPFLDDPTQGSLPPARSPGVPQEPDPFAPAPPSPGYLGTIPAAFRQENPIVSTYNSFSGSLTADNRIEPGYNPLDTLKGTPHENDDPGIYLGSPNESYTRSLMGEKDQEDADRRTLAASGWAGTAAGITAGALNPLYYLPILGEAGVAARAAGFAAQAAVGSAASEAILQKTQVSRPLAESGENIASATIIGGVLGGALGYLSPVEQKAAADALDQVRPRMTPDGSLIPSEVQPAQQTAQGGYQLTEEQQAHFERYNASTAARTRGAYERMEVGKNEDAIIGAVKDAGITKEESDQYIGAAARILRSGKEIDPLAAYERAVMEDYGTDQHLADLGLSSAMAQPFGAAASDTRQLKPISLLGLEKVPGITKLSPNADLYFNGSTPAKRGARDMVETGIRFEPEAPSPYGSPIESIVRSEKNSYSVAAHDTLQDGFVNYQKGGGTENYTNYKSAVAEALYSGDQHFNPDVQAAAQKLRSEVFDPVKRLAQDTKDANGNPMLAEALETPKGADSFFPIMYKREAVAANRATFSERITNWLGDEQAEKVALQGRLSQAMARGDETAAQDVAKEWRGKSTTPEEMMATKTDLSRQELQSRANEIIDRILGSPDGRLPYDAASGGPRVGYTGTQQQPRGSLNSRDFAFPQAELARMGLIQTDPEHVIPAMLRTVLPDAYLTRRFGDVDATSLMREINESYSAKVDAGGNAVKLEARRQADIKEVAAMRDRLRGIYGWNPTQSIVQGAVIRDLLNISALARLGTSVFNRLGDIGANATFRYGLGSVFQHEWSPLVRGLFGNYELLSKIKSQAAQMGVGVDGLLGHLRHNMADVMSSVEPGNKFSRGVAWLTDKSMLVNLHGPWTDYTKALTVNVAQNKFAEIAGRIAAGKGTAKDLATMADANISTSMATRIAGQYDQHASTVQGAQFPESHAWTDRGAAQAFDAAMSRESNAVVLTAGHGDKPLFMSTPVGSLVMQFHSFTAAAYEKIFIANLQKRDADSLMGVITAMGMGALSYTLYSAAKGEKPDPQQVLSEALQRSALSSWFGEANQIVSKATGRTLDYNRLLGATQPLSRRSENSLLSEAAGPALGGVADVAQAAGQAAHGTASAKDVHAIRQGVVPLQNLMFFRILFDHVEAGIDRLLGYKPGKNITHEK